MRFNIIHQLKQKYPVQLLCKIAQVSRSGYYKWLKRQNCRRDHKIKQIISSEYHRLKGIYGYRRMRILLKRKYGIHVNHKRVYRLMKLLQLKAVIRRRRPYTQYSSYGNERLPNVLNRQFKTDQPDRKWVTDVTYLTVNGQRMYLSVILDLFNNEVVSYQLSHHAGLELVIKTVEQAVEKRNVRGVLLHSDQGGQYTSAQYIQLLRTYGIVQSMSRKGDCLDNAPMESFFGHLKSEFLYDRKFSNKQQFCEELCQYIHFYNNERFQAKLNEMAPAEYRSHFMRSA